MDGSKARAVSCVEVCYWPRPVCLQRMMQHNLGAPYLSSSLAKMVRQGNRLCKSFSFDFSKAFDSVPHAIACNKLMSLKINPYVINWIVSFLSSRKQRVVVDGFVTEFASINRGVPQGTVLGPILFSIMVNDIRPVYPERNLLLKYADDLTLSVPVSAHQDHSFIEVNSIQHWAVRNRMKLNLTKTWEMVVHGRISKPLPPLVQGMARKS